MVSGRARLSHDREQMQALWHPILKAWFPDGLETEDIAFLRVEVTQADYWDPGFSRLVQIAGFVKARATGERAAPGDNQKPNM